MIRVTIEIVDEDGGRSVSTQEEPDSESSGTLATMLAYAINGIRQHLCGRVEDVVDILDAMMSQLDHEYEPIIDSTRTADEAAEQQEQTDSTSLE